MKSSALDDVKDYMDLLPPLYLRACIVRKHPPSQDAFFEQLYEDVRQVISLLEGAKHDISAFDDSDDRVHERENSLRGRIVHQLCCFGYEAIADPDHNGHIDIQVKVPRFALNWLAECKIHSGYPWLVKGLKQLHDRYSDGRCGKSGFFVFSFQKNARSVMATWRQEIENQRLCHLEGKPVDDAGRLEFSSVHRNEASGLLVETRHFAVALWYAPTDVEP